MKNTLTPGRLALWGVIAVVIGAVLSIIFSRGYDNDTDGAGFLFQVLSVIAYAAGVLLLVGAGIAKVVQVGIRSAGD
ncbi:MAG: hypothetical protein JWM40_371 [Frankiales bacterium]|nr:hypothetical protein [Frankiales bacterium]